MINNRCENSDDGKHWVGGVISREGSWWECHLCKKRFADDKGGWPEDALDTYIDIKDVNKA